MNEDKARALRKIRELSEISMIDDVSDQDLDSLHFLLLVERMSRDDIKMSEIH